MAVILRVFVCVLLPFFILAITLRVFVCVMLPFFFLGSYDFIPVMSTSQPTTLAENEKKKSCNLYSVCVYIYMYIIFDLYKTGDVGRAERGPAGVVRGGWVWVGVGGFRGGGYHADGCHQDETNAWSGEGKKVLS